MSKRKPTPPVQGPGSDQWRSPDEHDNPEAVREAVAREFPDGASELDGTSRREFMQLVGGTLALAGVGTMAGCKDPPQNVRAYNIEPPDVIPGRPLHYATALTHAGFATGVLATAWEGRPTKIEGNPEHPLTKGATSSFEQASILSLYDDKRASRRSRSAATAAAGSSCAAPSTRTPPSSRATAGRSWRSSWSRRRRRCWRPCRSASPPPSPRRAGSRTRRCRWTKRTKARASPSAARSRPSSISPRPRWSSRSTPTSSAAGRRGWRRSASGPSAARRAAT